MKVKELIERMNKFYEPDDEIVVTWCDQDEMFDRMVDILGEDLSEDLVSIAWHLAVTKTEMDYSTHGFNTTHEIESFTSDALEYVCEGIRTKFKDQERFAEVLQIVDEAGVRAALEAEMKAMGDE